MKLSDKKFDILSTPIRRALAIPARSAVKLAGNLPPADQSNPREPGPAKTTLLRSLSSLISEDCWREEVLSKASRKERQHSKEREGRAGGGRVLPSAIAHDSSGSCVYAASRLLLNKYPKANLTHNPDCISYSDQSSSNGLVVALVTVLYCYLEADSQVRHFSLVITVMRIEETRPVTSTG
jgi:hypothetical protein